MFYVAITLVLVSPTCSLEVLETGTITFAAPHREPWDPAPSCSLDLADAGHHTLEEVGDLFNLSRERIRQIERKALRKVRLLVVAGDDAYTVRPERKG